MRDGRLLAYKNEHIPKMVPTINIYYINRSTRKGKEIDNWSRFYKGWQLWGRRLFSSEQLFQLMITVINILHGMPMYNGEKLTSGRFILKMFHFNSQCWKFVYFEHLHANIWRQHFDCNNYHIFLYTFMFLYIAM